MTDDLENKPQKNNEIKKDEKLVKPATADKLEGAATSSTKSKELKKETSEKVLSEASPPSDVDKNDLWKLEAGIQLGKDEILQYINYCNCFSLVQSFHSARDGRTETTATGRGCC